MKLKPLTACVLLSATFLAPASFAQVTSATTKTSSRSGGSSGGGPGEVRPRYLNSPPGFAANAGGGAAYGSWGYTSGGGRGSPIQLLKRGEVQKDLALTDPQKESILGIIQRFRDTEKQTLAQLQSNPASERPSFQQQDEALRQARARATDEIKKMLTPEQVKRLQQLGVQHQGAEALFDPDVAKALQLSDAQQQTLKNMRSDADRELRAWFAPPAPRAIPHPAGSQTGPNRNGSGGGGTSGGGSGALRETGPSVASRSNNVARIIRESERKMLEEVLTPDQQAKLKELQGRPCALPFGYVGRTVRNGGSSFGSGGNAKRY